MATPITPRAWQAARPALAVIALACASMGAWLDLAWLAGLSVLPALAALRLPAASPPLPPGTPEDAAPGRNDDQLRAALVEQSADAYLCLSKHGAIAYTNARARALFFDGGDRRGENFLQMLGNAPAVLREALLGDDERVFTIELDGWPESYHVSRRVLSLRGAPHTLVVVKRMTRQLGRRELAVSRRLVRLLSHEVNNSLAPISSLVRTARRVLGETPDPKVKRALDTIGERADHLHGFIDAYARVARLPVPTPRASDWRTLVEHVTAMHPGLVVEAVPDAPGHFDPVQMQQLLVNLVKNALEAGSAAEAVRLSVHVVAEGVSELSVRDGGQGFSDEAREQALLPLYTTKPSGSGLGLALCREIVEAHGGSIALSNHPDGGALVRVLLPGPRSSPDVELSRSQLSLTRA